MELFKLIKVSSRLISGVIRFALKVMILFIILTLLLGAKASLYMTFIFIVLALIRLINKVLVVPVEECHCKKKDEVSRPYYYPEDDRWVPGEPPISQKAHIQGFFPEQDDH